MHTPVHAPHRARVGAWASGGPRPVRVAGKDSVARALRLHRERTSQCRCPRRTPGSCRASQRPTGSRPRRSAHRFPCTASHPASRTRCKRRPGRCRGTRSPRPTSRLHSRSAARCPSAASLAARAPPCTGPRRTHGSSIPPHRSTGRSRCASLLHPVAPRGLRTSWPQERCTVRARPRCSGTEARKPAGAPSRGRSVRCAGLAVGALGGGDAELCGSPVACRGLDTCRRWRRSGRMFAVSRCPRSDQACAAIGRSKTAEGEREEAARRTRRTASPCGTHVPLSEGSKQHVLVLNRKPSRRPACRSSV